MCKRPFAMYDASPFRKRLQHSANSKTIIRAFPNAAQKGTACMQWQSFRLCLTWREAERRRNRRGRKGALPLGRR